MTPHRRHALLLVLSLVAILAVSFTIKRLMQPEPDTQRCAALVGPGSTDAERDRAFARPVCKGVRDVIR